MARQPLFASVCRSLRAGDPSPRPTRRRFLSLAGQASMAALAAPSLSALAGPAAPRVVVVGAGLAGLTCAHRLRQAGLRATVLEAATRVGGRTLTLRGRFPDGQQTELGAEFVDTSHVALRRLARELGLTLLDLYYTGGLQGHTFAVEGRVLHGDAHLVEPLRPVAEAIRRDLGPDGRHGQVSFGAGTPEGRALDRLSLAEWLDTRAVAGFARKVLEAAFVGEYGRELQEQSALNLLLALEGQGEQLYEHGAERYRLAEGNDALAQRLAQGLDGPVELGSALESLRADGPGYLLGLRRGAASHELRADLVVLALPFTLLRQVELRLELPEAKRRAVAELGYGTNGKVVAGFSRRAWSEAGSTGYVFTDLGFQSCWDTSRGQSGTHALMTNFVGGRLGAELGRGTPGERAAAFVAQLERVFPGAAPAHTGEAVRVAWIDAPFAKGSYTCYGPGQYQSLAGVEGLPVGRVLFAGEHTSAEFSGYMNGAVESGERAARQALKLLGRRQAS